MNGVVVRHKRIDTEEHYLCGLRWDEVGADEVARLSREITCFECDRGYAARENEPVLTRKEWDLIGHFLYRVWITEIDTEKLFNDHLFSNIAREFDDHAAKIKFLTKIAEQGVY